MDIRFNGTGLIIGDQEYDIKIRENGSACAFSDNDSYTINRDMTINYDPIKFDNKYDRSRFKLKCGYIDRVPDAKLSFMIVEDVDRDDYYIREDNSEQIVSRFKMIGDARDGYEDGFIIFDVNENHVKKITDINGYRFIATNHTHQDFECQIIFDGKEYFANLYPLGLFGKEEYFVGKAEVSVDKLIVGRTLCDHDTAGNFCPKCGLKVSCI